MLLSRHIKTLNRPADVCYSFVGNELTALDASAWPGSCEKIYESGCWEWICLPPLLKPLTSARQNLVTEDQPYVIYFLTQTIDRLLLQNSFDISWRKKSVRHAALQRGSVQTVDLKDIQTKSCRRSRLRSSMAIGVTIYHLVFGKPLDRWPVAPNKQREPLVRRNSLGWLW